MLESLMTSINTGTFTLSNILIVIGTSIILGLAICLTYIKTHKKEGYVPSFTITLIMLPVIISIIILLVGNNVARAFSLAGAFSIIRFRSAPGDPKDISYIFFTLAVGLASGMGFIGYAVLFTIILCLVMIIIDITKFASPKSKSLELKITVPENLNYEGVFEDILEKYTVNWNLARVRTRDFGSLFELSYRVSMKPEENTKKFIDELRCRNGNLNIILTSDGLEERVYN
ncbi:DUF4956 domain-containing protein [Clostridium sp. NSJ-6]|uniref:DUF4956 domain-containing protein n=1 Tax=Clostridium hominis TaxID=2763036 RepID=A0ABR7DCB4_9CLOT|nr:DUF4956 domain-containing protein [Clostridium hominis]MBC5629031.1 DUF4956 domain-containing protein [Clostridium hominis]MDU2671909.1 DUF4956 domain-containing protein [Clostridium sp.]